MTSSFQDLSAKIWRQVPHAAGRFAVMAPGRMPLSYEALWTLTGNLSGFLANIGLRRGDAVAVAMPDGPEFLTTFLAVSRVAIYAPLNPAFRVPEFEFSLSDLNPRALIVQAGMDSSAISVAHGMGIPIIEVLPDNKGPAGTLSFTYQVTACRQDEPRYAPDTALLHHTSATTGRPKLVPLTHAQIIAMVAVVRKAFPQADAGRVLMITPQIHLQCILSMLVQLFSGGASICTSGFRPDCFLDWMKTFSPTQYTANPTLHRAILSLCQSGGSHPSFRLLRFVTSGGSPLSEELLLELEHALGIPVIDGYGLTEAGRVTMTPLDPARRKPGSSGICVGPEVSIMDKEGRFLSPGKEGEIVLRGPTVITGYAHDPEANRQAFRNGWFCTGDLGHLDADGFLFVTGRLKEMINRGGEKILPYEIEAVLASHPAVQEVAVFGYPHPRLGEEVGAAIVLRPMTTASAQELRGMVAERLAEFKVPRRIRFVADIPKGRTGKFQRAKLVESLGLSDRMPEEGNQKPYNQLEALLAGIWASVLGVQKVGRGDDFFVLGGDSLLAATLMARVQEACGCRLGTRALAVSGAFADFTAAVREEQNKMRSQPNTIRAVPGLVALRADGPGIPLFLVQPMDIGVIGLRHLVHYIGGSRPVYGFETIWCDCRGNPFITLGSIVAQYIAELCRVQPHGPYLLGGRSVGGMLAFEMGRWLKARGETIGGIILIDSECFGLEPDVWKPRRSFIRPLLRIFHHILTIARLPLRRWNDYIRSGIKARENHKFRQALLSNICHHLPLPLSAPTLLLRCLDEGQEHCERLKRLWSGIVTDGLTIRDIPGTHRTCLQDPHVRDVAEEMLRFLP